MPRKARKKQESTKEEKAAESYFPLDESDVKRSVEKKIKKPEREDLEKIENLSLIKPQKKKRKSRVKKTVSKKIKKISLKKSIENYSPSKIKLKKDGYELIITEKPQAALKISDALGKSVKRDFHKIPYYEVDRNGKKIIVACAVGHLFTLKQNSVGSAIPVFDIKWVPNFIAKKQDFTKRYYDTISRLVKQAKSITIATDYDVEGEVIGLNVMRFICGQSDANRMKFSTLTTKELNDAYEKKSKEINWGQAIAGETRHYLDWFYGINLSRALMNSIKTTGAFKIMSIGRVQGPTLNLIVKKEKEIQSFKSQQYWQVFITIKNSHILELKYNKDIFNKADLEKFKELNEKTVEAITEKKSQILPPNPPFDLTNLQTEAYRLYDLTPARTLQIAQSLYLAGLISYPRTSSQKLPDSIGYKEILKRLAKKYNVENLIKREKPVEGKKSDPAHPSIYPTGNFQLLSGDDEKLYNLIVKRFLSLFCDNAIIDNKTVKVKVNTNERKVNGQGNLGVLTFSVRGSSIRKKAWIEIYPITLKEKEIPDINGNVKIINVKFEEKKTQPPKRYTQASIISELEKRNLGTKATRSTIIETLYYRNYVKEKSIEATALGISLIETMEKYSPIIIDEELTRNVEKEMLLIAQAKNKFEDKKEKIIEENKKVIIKITSQFKKNEKEIGKELLKANISLTEKLKEENILTMCPICKKGDLAITYSKKTKKYFVACNAYPECKTTYSLPPNGLTKKQNKKCEECEFPMLINLRRGRKPWIFCFNRDCETNKKRLEKYYKKKEEKQK